MFCNRARRKKFRPQCDFERDLLGTNQTAHLDDRSQHMPPFGLDVVEMARLNGTSAPATTHNSRVSNGEDQPSYEKLETGEQHNTPERDISAMRTRLRREIQEPPADYEEAKRNLIRQNRNLARSHSAQSLQIRSLSNAVSDLIATNRELKQENILLYTKLCEVHDGSLKDGLERIKGMMREHVRTMAELLANYTDSEEESVTFPLQSSPETRKNECLGRMEFRDRPSLQEIMSERQLPAIQEMPAMEEDSQRTSGTSSESPDLGPPPVARFEDVDIAEPIPSDEGPVNISANIEARRRRKDSIGGSVTRRRSALVSPLTELEKTSSSLKTGAKRKISDRDREDSMLGEDEPFQYSRRRTSVAADKTIDPVSKAAVVEKRPTLKQARKALAEKSTNLSPKKANPATEKEDIKGQKKVIKESGRRNSRQPRVLVQDAQEGLPPTTELELPVHNNFPRTPAALEILSPVSSEPDGRHVVKPDTPPPGDLSISSSTASIEGARPSRRARASVNYAEPSLVAKMRRPGKEMLDALSGLQDPRNVMSTSASSRRSSSRDVVSKSLFGAETMTTDSRAQNKRSPLLKRGEEDDCELSPIDEKSTVLSLATLMTGAKSAKDNVPEEELDIYDFKDTTPPETPEQAVTSQPIKGSRRHSAASKASTKLSKSNEAVPFGRSSKGAVRRKSMMV